MKNSGNKNRRYRRTIVFLLLVALAVVFVFAFFTGLTVRNYTIESGKVTGGGTVKIVAIADLHSNVYGEAQKPLLDMIAAQKPDIIALAGDIVDNKVPDIGAKMFLRAVPKIAPVYYVSGNHEFQTQRYDEIKKMIEGCGIMVLSGERKYITINGTDLCVCGIDDPVAFEYSDDPRTLKYKDADGMLSQFSDLGDDTFNILLAHRPELIESYAKYDFDLVLSGHTHGGQVRIPLVLNGTFAPDQGFFPKYAGGRYDLRDMTMIVSRGLSLSGKAPRVFDPPEIVAVCIEGKK